MTIAVTGASGFIGTAVVEALRRAGRPVRRLARQAPATAGGDVAIVGDLAQPLELAAALQGVKAIVHCAGLAHQAPGAQGEARIIAVNATATVALAKEAARAGVQRFVFISSAKVMGERSGQRPLSERDPPAPADAYARSKLTAEQGLRSMAADAGLDLIILRPPLVYGPGVRANFRRLLAACDSPWPLPLGAADAPRSLVAVGSLADAVRRCIDSPLRGCHVFFVADREAPTAAELIAQLRRLLGRPHRLPAVPLKLVRAAAKLAGRGADLDRLTLPFVLDTQALREAVDWQPSISLDRGLADTVAWWRCQTSATHDRR
jgi:UDP-glucose 4-epimerase